MFFMLAAIYQHAPLLEIAPAVWTPAHMAQRAAGAVTEPPEPRGSWEEPVGRAVLRLLEVVEVASPPGGRVP